MNGVILKEGKVQKIIYPTDGSKTAKKALEFAAHIAKDTKAEIIVLSVADAKLRGFPRAMEPQMMQELKKEAQKIAEKARKELEKDGLKVQAMTAEGSPSEEIVRLARKEKADLIVMGTHGITGLARVIIGSVADHVIREAQCPVVLVPAKR